MFIHTILTHSCLVQITGSLTISRQFLCRCNPWALLQFHKVNLNQFLIGFSVWISMSDGCTYFHKFVFCFFFLFIILLFSFNCLKPATVIVLFQQDHLTHVALALPLKHALEIKMFRTRQIRLETPVEQSTLSTQLLNIYPNCDLILFRFYMLLLVELKVWAIVQVYL